MLEQKYSEMNVEDYRLISARLVALLTGGGELHPTALFTVEVLEYTVNASFVKHKGRQYLKLVSEFKVTGSSEYVEVHSFHSREAGEIKINNKYCWITLGGTGGRLAVAGNGQGYPEDPNQSQYRLERKGVELEVIGKIKSVSLRAYALQALTVLSAVEVRLVNIIES